MKTKRMNGVKSAITMVAMAVALMVGGTSVKAADVNVDGGATKAASKRLNYNTNYVAHFDGAGSNDWYVIKPTGQNNFYEIVIKNFNIFAGGNGYYGFHAYVMNGAGDVYMDIDTHKNKQTVTKVKLRDIKEEWVKVSKRTARKKIAETIELLLILSRMTAVTRWQLPHQFRIVRHIHGKWRIGIILILLL